MVLPFMQALCGYSHNSYGRRMLREKKRLLTLKKLNYLKEAIKL